MADSKLTVAYWDCQAAGHPTRLLLAYHKIDFEDKAYVVGEGDEWFKKDKLSLNTNFPNLPYIKDGDFVLTESGAVIQYAALKTGNEELLGKTKLDEIRIAQFAGVLRDQLLKLYEVTGVKEEAERDKFFEEKIAPFTEKISKVLGDKSYCIGYLTYVDFPLAFQSDVLMRMRPEYLKKWPNLVAHRDRIWNSEGVQAYRKSKTYPKSFVPFEPFGEEKVE